MAVVAAVIVIIVDNKINRTNMETVAIPSRHMPNRKDNKDNRLLQVAPTTPMQLVSFILDQSRALLTKSDGGYANYAQLWYQALAAQGQGDTTKPPGTS